MVSWLARSTLITKHTQVRTHKREWDETRRCVRFLEVLHRPSFFFFFPLSLLKAFFVLPVCIGSSFCPPCLARTILVALHTHRHVSNDSLLPQALVSSHLFCVAPRSSSNQSPPPPPFISERCFLRLKERRDISSDKKR